MNQAIIRVTSRKGMYDRIIIPNKNHFAIHCTVWLQRVKTKPGFLELGSATILDFAKCNQHDGIVKKIKAAIKDDNCQFLCQTIKNESSHTSQCIEPDLQEGL